MNGLLIIIILLLILAILGVCAWLLKTKNAPQKKKSALPAAKDKEKKEKERKPATEIIRLDLQSRLTGALKERFDQIHVESFEGAGFVASALDRKKNQKVTIKALNPDSASDPQALKLFSAEMEAIQRINHPNVIRIFEVENKNPGMLYYVSEFLEGTTLENLLQKEGKLPLKRAFSIANEILKALVHLHNNKIVHRDIRPNNVFVTNKDVVKLIHFGIVKVLTSKGEELKSSTVIGTTDFASPEQMQGLTITGKSDVYSLGVCLYHMLSGQFPYPGLVAALDPAAKPIDLKTLCPDLPEDFLQALSPALEKNPDKRPTSMDWWKTLHFLKI